MLREARQSGLAPSHHHSRSRRLQPQRPRQPWPASLCHAIITSSTWLCTSCIRAALFGSVSRVTMHRTVSSRFFKYSRTGSHTTAARAPLPSSNLQRHQYGTSDIAHRVDRSALVADMNCVMMSPVLAPGCRSRRTRARQKVNKTYVNPLIGNTHSRSDCSRCLRRLVSSRLLNCDVEKAFFSTNSAHAIA